MALDYRKCAEEIAKNIGGGENVVSAAHCATRLRLVIADNGKLNKKALDNIDGVQGMFESGGQLQLIIGTGTVNKVYDEFLAVTGASAASKEDVKAAAAAQAPLWRRIIKALGDVFVPILPAIVASGLLMGVVEALGKIPGLGFSSSPWYSFLDMIASTALAYLPVLVAVSAARVFGGNIFLGGVIGLSMINSGLLNAWNTASVEGVAKFFGLDVSNLVSSDVASKITDGDLLSSLSPYLVDWSDKSINSMSLADAGISIPTWDLLPFLHIQKVGYQGHVIPVVIAIFLMCKIENWLHKRVPEMIDLFVTPITTVFITYFLTFSIIGPAFSLLENAVLGFFKALVTVGFGIGALIAGAVYPFTVVMGLHHMFNIIELGMLAGADGINTWMPIASAANFAQFGACLAVGIKSHRAKTKAIAVPASMSASLGITEPAIFGVNLRYMKPLVCGAIGGAVGAWFGSIAHIGATANGVTGIPGYLITNKPLPYTIMLLIAFGVAFGLSFVTHKDEEEEAEPEEAAPAPAPAPAPAAEKPANKAAAAADVNKPGAEVISCNMAKKVKAPAFGEVVSYEDIPDPAFSSGALGAGVGIKPDKEIVVAPFNGEIISVTDTKHAVGIAGDGIELLIHVGVDTVKMGGDGFECFVKEGDKVKAGDKLITFSKDKIKAAGYSDMVVVLVTNSFEFDEVKPLVG